jgi:hypothetical protein
MKKEITFALFLVLFFTALFLQIGTVLGQNQLQWSNTYNIEVHADGSAAWTIEQRALLQTAADQQTFEENYSSIAYFDEKINSTQELVKTASLSTGRNMSAENFEITTSIEETVTGSYGVIEYQYNWIGFAEIKNGQIFIGDAFTQGPYLSRDDILIIKYPANYTVVNVSPKPDETINSNQTLIWYGPRSFENDEPTVVLGARYNSWNYMPLIIGLIIAGIAGIGSAGLWFFKFRRKENGVIAAAPQIKPMIEDDGEKVVKLLKEAGGSLYQSTITKQLGFSKSKTSGLLKNMEKNGSIRRQKKGREKTVTLIAKDH